MCLHVVMHFEVEDIRGSVIDKKGRMHYLVKWLGYGEEFNSWVMVNNVKVQETIDNYW